MGILEMIAGAMPKGRLAAMLAGADRDKSAGRRGARGYWDRPSRYDGAALRAIRAKKGVGRPPKMHSHRIGQRRGYVGYPAYWHGDTDSLSWYVGTDRLSPNYAEWLRKPRSKRHAAQGAKQ